MKIQQSYIFINQKKYEEPKRNDDGTVVFKIGLNIFDLLSKKIDDFEKNISEFKEDNFKYESYGKGTINVSNTKVPVSIQHNIVTQSEYIDIVALNSNHDISIQALEKIHSYIEEIKTDKVMIVTFDSISKYYTDKIYPHLNTFERRLRQLMFNTYISHFGKEYFKKTTETNFNQDVFSRISSNSKARKSAKFNNRLKNYFYELDYGHIIKLLFEPRWTLYDDEKKKSIIEKNNFSELSNDDIKELIESIGPRSDWDRFFSDKVKNKNIYNDIKELQKLRNKVAHCKLFYNEDYNKASKLVQRLNIDISAAISLTESRDYEKRNVENFYKIMLELADVFSDFVNSIQESSIISDEE